MVNSTAAFTLWRKMNISLVALIAGIAIAHIALLAGVVFLMATTDFKPDAPLFIALASPAAGYTVPSDLTGLLKRTLAAWLQGGPKLPTD